jgi:hypothetical protein
VAPQGLTIAERRIVSGDSKPETCLDIIFSPSRHQSGTISWLIKYDYLFTVDSLE